MMMYPDAQRAFTLVELSIVLVILGLLVGGVLSGQSLIHAAELRKVSSDFTKYQTAVNAFRDKYFALPGDMPNAISYWGAAHATPGTCLNTASTTPATCNGNGDGIIDLTGERLRAWQHLANAGMVEGSFSGIEKDFHSAAGYNVPKSPLGKGFYSFRAGDSYGMNACTLTNGVMDCNSNYILVANAGFDASYNEFEGGGGVMKNEDAYNIDMKMDDGKADTGKLRGNLYDQAGTDVEGTCSPYNLADASKLCSLFYRL